VEVSYTGNPQPCPYTLSPKKKQYKPQEYTTPNIAPSLKARALATSKVKNSSPLFTIPMHIVYNFRIHIPTSCFKKKQLAKSLEYIPIPHI